ncbi:MAG: glycine--tRNA ligase subunit beta [Gammaproteobacteria bacterium]|nr:MAG: glycine--tRNA ligase subunit beta [Gammaproteobacteria bacterium]
MAKKKAKKIVRKKTMVAENLLVELGTEELPPKSLQRLSSALAKAFCDGLKEADLVEEDVQYKPFATPRRLAVHVSSVLKKQPDLEQVRRGPAVQAAYDEQGRPTQALWGFAKSCGVAPEKLERLLTDKGEWVVYRLWEKGRRAEELVPEILDRALKKLPISKRMRWGDLNAEFVRPVHWLVLLHGTRVINTELLTVTSGRMTYGHRFHAPRAIKLAHADDYDMTLKRSGSVMADFKTRKQKIRQDVERLAARQNGKAAIDEALLDEVTGLVEWPVPVLGAFDKVFLNVPSEALITTMQDNQKYFPVTTVRGKLLPYFITVSNIRSKSKVHIQHGNERVIRARFSDADFFWQNDRKQPLASRCDALKNVVFHIKLGSMAHKSARVARLTTHIASLLGADQEQAHRAATLAKADLMTGMVGEFPELQGVMGRYYALNDKEPGNVPVALEEQYRPRFAGDVLPRTVIGQALAIADKLDTLAGIFSINEIPTGDKDPFALRRAALGVLRIIIEGRLELSLMDCLNRAAAAFNVDQTVVAKLYGFMMERLRAYYIEGGISRNVFEAVYVTRPERPLDFDRRLRAVMSFLKLKEADSLTVANKRIRNILKQGGDVDWDHVSTGLLQHDAEKALYSVIVELNTELAPLFDAGDYTTAMKRLASLRPRVDRFFDEVMVMVDEEAVRDNRLALLQGLSRLFLRVADLSRLQG